MKHIVYLALLMTLNACVSYPLPDAKLKPKEVCGKSKCSPGNLGFPLQFKLDPYSPDLYTSTTPADIAYSVLGHTTKTKDTTGSIIRTCSSDNTNPFSKADIVPKIAVGGRTIDYTRSAKLEIDIVPTVSATLNELQKQLDISEYLNELTVKLEAGYKSINKADSTLKGTYYEWGLSDAVIKNLHTPKYKGCTEYLQKNDRSLITAVGFINFYTSVNTSDYSKFIADINALFTAKGINFDVSPTIVREVTKTLKASTKNGFQIVVWKKAVPSMWAD